MGDALYDEIVMNKDNPKPCRVYAPVGTHEELLAYLVRRLLENGANSSFVNRIVDEKLPIDEMVFNPVDKLAALTSKPHPGIPLPKDLFQPSRANSNGLDLNRESAFLPVAEKIAQNRTKTYQAKPTTMAPGNHRNLNERFSPIERTHHLGTVTLANPADIEETLQSANRAWVQWQFIDAQTRASYLETMANLLEEHAIEFYSLLTFEGGKTLDDAVSEVREAIDFCHYYALQAKCHFQTPQTLVGPTGELNQLSLHGRGIIACISPWNFPLAIFLGQVTAALAAGNCVIAKPASQTVFIASRAIELLHEAGIPKGVVQLLPGSGALVGNALINDVRIAGVVFTGSTETARNINQQLAARNGVIVPFVAETGGQNAMIVDSSALSEQVTQDVI
ncbi:MAG TPA: proline dehydrogenase family protein, partial [Candidatus Berkiella sp.]|nr:proline dehydrogenase family protein [Candidatus Berkiella sp.]